MSCNACLFTDPDNSRLFAIVPPGRHWGRAGRPTPRRAQAATEDTPGDASGDNASPPLPSPMHTATSQRPVLSNGGCVSLPSRVFVWFFWDAQIEPHTPLPAIDTALPPCFRPSALYEHQVLYPNICISTVAPSHCEMVTVRFFTLVCGALTDAPWKMMWVEREWCGIVIPACRAVGCSYIGESKGGAQTPNPLEEGGKKEAQLPGQAK